MEINNPLSREMDTEDSDSDSTPFWTKSKKIIAMIAGGIVLATLIVLLIVFVALKKSDESSPAKKYNPFSLKAVAKDPRNYTLILENTHEVSTSLKNQEAKFLAVQVAALHDHLVNIKIFDANRTRWEVPKALEKLSGGDLPGLMDVSEFINIFQHYSLEELGVTLAAEPFGLELWGAETQRLGFPIVSTVHKPLQFFDKFIEYELEVPCDAVFGLPQVADGLVLKEGNYTMWNQYHVDQDQGEEGQGSISFLLCRVKPDKFLALFMDNSNAHMVSLWKTANSTRINYKLTGGIIDLKIFHLGEPTAILKLYHEFVGRPACPPLWSFGLQHSRAGYDSLKTVQEAIARYQSTETPLDGVWMDQSLMDRYRTFTVAHDRFKGLKEAVALWRSQGINFAHTVFPQIKEDAEYSMYVNLTRAGAVMKDPRNGSDVPQKSVGLNTGNAVFMDLFDHNARRIMGAALDQLYEDGAYDGIWIRQETPYTTCNGFCQSPATKPTPDEFDNLPFEPIKLLNNTLPLSSYHSMEYAHYNTHNLFPLLMAKTVSDLEREDAFEYKARIASSVAAPRLGHYSTLWRGNVEPKWETLAKIIRETLAYGMAGIPFVGYPICGFHSSNDPELCVRWYQLAAFLPEMRIYHDGKGKVEPFEIGDKRVKEALAKRYQIVRFLYTKLTEAELWGGPVWEPLGFLFPNDPHCLESPVLDQTFMIGKSLYVVPALTPGQTETQVYFPNHHWYHFDTLSLVHSFAGPQGTGKSHGFPANVANVFIKGGSIIPVQNGAVHNTQELANMGATLIIAPDHEGKARGTMLVARDIEQELEKQFYNHYSFTFVAGIFRVNMIEGYYNPMEAPVDFFKEVVILNSAVDKPAYACLLTTELVLHPLDISYDSSKKTLKISAPPTLLIKLKDIDSITFGQDATQSLCKRSTVVKTSQYAADHKSASVELVSTDQQQYAAQFKLLDDAIMYLALKPSDGKKYWMVPDVLESGIRDQIKAKKNLDEYGMVLAAANAPFGFVLQDPGKSKERYLSTEGEFLIQKERFMEFRLRINGNRIYGLGERITEFELKDGWYTLFSKGVASPIETRKRPGNNMYGSYPFYMYQLNKETEFGAVFILTSNALDVRVQHEPNHGMLITHVLTSPVLELFVIQKSSPEQIIKEYHSLIGKPVLVPYWSFGYHQCRWGYDTQQKLEDVVANFTAKGIPLDVLWSDIDYMTKYQDFTVDTRRYPSMVSFLTGLKEKNITYVPILDAGIARQKGYEAYETGKATNLFIKSAKTGEDLLGVVWPGYAVFTDFTHPDAESYWTSHLEKLHEILPFDGIWLDMNELTSFCDGECPDELHYVDNEFATDGDDMMLYYPGHQRLNKMTISLSGKHYNGESENNMHNMYGFYTIKATSKYFDAVVQKRPFIISRSTHPGSGRYGSHWLGDNYARPEFMKYSITGIYNFQMFGIPFVGADACGFIGDVDLELCKRWMQLAAFYPFYRNHKETFWGHHEPFVEDELAMISTHAIKTRYTFFRYLYSNYFEVALNGGTFFRPLFWEFPTDPQSYAHNEETFMLGSALKVSPALHPNNGSTFSAYFPNADWFDYFDGRKIMDYNPKATSGKMLVLNSSYHPVPILNIHVKGGSILPVAITAEKNLAETINGPIGLIVAPFEGKATGWMYYDDDGYATISKGAYQKVEITFSGKLITFAMDKPRNFEYQYHDDYLREVKIFGAAQYKDTKWAKITLVDGTVKTVIVGYDAQTQILRVRPEEKVYKLKNISWGDKLAETE